MTTLTTWTFFGHYEDSGELAINHAVLGEVADVYPDSGEFPGGLWCDYGTGATMEAAEDDARSKAAADNGETP